MNEIEAVGPEAIALSEHGDMHVQDAAAKTERPWIFGLLISPSAVVANGVIQGGVLAFLLTQQHVAIGSSSKIISFLALPTSLYFLWSPITDFFVRRRTWLLVGTLGSALFMAAGLFQPNLASTRAIVLMLASACFCQLVVSSCGGMMGAFRREESKRVASGFYQAGSMGLGAAAVWILLHVSAHGHLDLLAMTVALLILVPGMLAFAAPKQQMIKGTSFKATMEMLRVEVKATFWRWAAVPYLCVFLFPMGSGAAVGLLPAVAQNYGINESQVAWMNGIGGALLMAGGALLGPLLPKKVRASVMYLTVCLVNALMLCVLWLGPLKPDVYFLGVTLYLLTIGICYAMFTAVLLEFMGNSGKSGSGRYSIINSLGNVPVLYMLVADGWGASHFGPRGLAGTEAVLGMVGGGLLLGYFLMARRTEASRQR